MDKNSIVVITGANSGIGKATSIELARTGACIIMACRSMIENIRRHISSR